MITHSVCFDFSTGMCALLSHLLIVVFSHNLELSAGRMFELSEHGLCTRHGTGREQSDGHPPAPTRRMSKGCGLGL